MYINIDNCIISACVKLARLRSTAMKFFFKTFILTVLILFVATAEFAFAGFGVTPPYFRNDSLTRNSTYQQQILLVRGDPNTALKATVEIDAPGFEDWITVGNGLEFELPRGEQKVPMKVKVQVPDDADFKQYKGAIRVKTGPVDGQVQGGAVNISLGAQINIDLNVIDREIKDFRVMRINISDLNEGHKLAWLYFPGKIRFGMTIENTGNVDVAPSDVIFRIYDFSGTVLLEETKHKNKIKEVPPYGQQKVFAELPTRLPAGNYLARYEIWNEDEIKQEGDVNLNIVKYGTLQEAGFGFSGLSLPHKISVILPILASLAFIIFVAHTIRSRRGRRISV